jgi:hypothetical protein
VETLKHWSNDGDTERPRVDGGGASAARENIGEHEPGEPEGSGANRKMSHVAGEEMELTEAAGAAETQWWLQNGRRTKASFTARA